MGEPREPWHSVEQQPSWQKDVPKMALAGQIPWNNKYFIPEGASMEHELLFRKIYWRYFKQICDTHGFDIDIYPGKAWAATYVPYIDFRKEIGLLMDLAKHAIQDYNNTSNDDYKYEVTWIEKVNYFVGEGREFLMTVKVKNLTLRTPIETFQIHAYRGQNEENVARLCRKKFFKLSLNREEASPEAREEAVELLLSKSSTS